MLCIAKWLIISHLNNGAGYAMPCLNALPTIAASFLTA
jgi:hypothetical protein